MTDFTGKEDKTLKLEKVDADSFHEALKELIREHVAALMIAMPELTELDSYHNVAFGTLHLMGEEFGKVALQKAMYEFADHVNNHCGSIKEITPKFLKNVEVITKRDMKNG